jgi:hypothetical protein
MKDLVQRLFVAGAAVVAFGLAPQVSAQQSSEGINPQVVPGDANCFDEADTVVTLCGFEPLGSFEVDPAKDAVWREGDTDVTFFVSKSEPLVSNRSQPERLEFTDASVLDQFFGGLGAVFVYAGSSANLYCYNDTGISMDSGLMAPQLEGISRYEACSGPGSCRLDPDDLEEICALAPFEIIKLENIDNAPISTCGCPNRDVTVEQCSDAVCSNFGPQTLDTNASRVSYGDGLVGSRCRKETTCEIPPAGGVVECTTKRICKRDNN